MNQLLLFVLLSRSRLLADRSSLTGPPKVSFLGSKRRVATTTVVVSRAKRIRTTAASPRLYRDVLLHVLKFLLPRELALCHGVSSTWDRILRHTQSLWQKWVSPRPRGFRARVGTKEDLWINIFKYLTFEERRSCSHVCPEWNSWLCRSDELMWDNPEWHAPYLATSDYRARCYSEIFRIGRAFCEHQLPAPNRYTCDECFCTVCEHAPLDSDTTKICPVREAGCCSDGRVDYREEFWGGCRCVPPFKDCLDRRRQILCAKHAYLRHSKQKIRQLCLCERYDKDCWPENRCGKCRELKCERCLPLGSATRVCLDCLLSVVCYDDTVPLDKFWS